MSGIESATASGLLKNGCYYIQYKPKNPDSDILVYEGTIRVLHVGADGMKIKQALNPGAVGEPVASEIRAAGDLYRRSPRYSLGPDGSLTPLGDTGANPDPCGRIPIFARRDYRYYLETTKVSDSDKGFFVRFEVYQFDRDGVWPNPGHRAIRMTPKAGSPGTFTGNVIDEDSGQEVGTATMQWISEFLRRARIVVNQVSKIDAKDGKNLPEPNVKDLLEKSQWKAAFAEAGWDVTIEEREVTIEKEEAEMTNPHPNRWTVGDLHNAMLQVKAEIAPDSERNADGSLGPIKIHLGPRPESKPDPAPSRPDPNGLDLVDKEWCFQIMCVPLLDGFDRGVSFDSGGTDSDNMPREGVAVACDYKFELTKDDYPESWGTAEGVRLQRLKNAFFRVAVHEIGHAMGLDHNTKDDGIMNTTDVIAEDALTRERAAEEAEARFDVEQIIASRKLPSFIGRRDGTRGKRLKSEALKARTNADGSKFADEINLKFHRDDLDRLRFGADVTVRPGTIFNDGGPFFGDQESTRADGFRLDVSPLLESVPLGAPVRVHLKLTNTSGKEQVVPKELSLSSCVLSGAVTDPNGNMRTYWPVKKCGDKDSKIVLKPFDSVSSDVTLLRGPQGSLFPASGGHRILAKVSWGTGSSKFFLERETDVQITPPVNDGHRIAALKVLATPDALLSLAIGGQHLVEGWAAIDAGFNDDVLKPHFAMVKFKEAAAAGNIPGACGALDAKSILSFAEIQRIAGIIEEWKNIKAYDIDVIIEMLKGRVEKLHLDFEISAASYKELKRQLSALSGEKPKPVEKPKA